MKTKVILLFSLFVVFVNCYGQMANSLKAKEILGNHFISLNEVLTILPSAPKEGEFEIPFSVQTLNDNPGSWLIPIQTRGVYKYFLVSLNFENEISTKKFLNSNDTLSLEATKQAVKILSTLRPNFLNRSESEISFKYFFRTKTTAPAHQGIAYKKILSYADDNFLILDWPNAVEIGVVNKDYISYLTRNSRGVEIKLGLAILPDDHPQMEYLQSVYVLTAFYKKI